MEMVTFVVEFGFILYSFISDFREYTLDPYTFWRKHMMRVFFPAPDGP